MRDQARTVKRGGAGALGDSVIVHDMMLCLLIVMTIISLLEMTVRLVTTAAVPVPLPVLVASAVTAFIAIADVVLIIVIALVILVMTIMLVVTIIRASAMAVGAMCFVLSVAVT